MRPRVALIIGAVTALVIGLLLVLLPDQLLSGFGVAATDQGRVLSRDVGSTLLGLAVINWLCRDAQGNVQRGLLAGNVIIQALELVVNGYEISAQQLPLAAAPGLVIHLVLGAIFLLALSRPTKAFL